MPDIGNFPGPGAFHPIDDIPDEHTSFGVSSTNCTGEATKPQNVLFDRRSSEEIPKEQKKSIFTAVVAFLRILVSKDNVEAVDTGVESSIAKCFGDLAQKIKEKIK